MGSLTVVEASDPAEWDRFVLSIADGSVEHLFAWTRIFSDTFGHQPRYLIARRGDEIAGVLPLVLVRSLLFGRSAVSLPFTSYGGLLVRDAEAAAALVAHARQIAGAFGAKTIELRNFARQVPNAGCRMHKVGARLALPTRADTLWSALDRKVRNQVRKAQKEGLTASRGGAELLDQFYPVFAENMRDLGTPVFPRRLFTEVLGSLDRASVCLVRLASEPVAASITLGWRDRVLVPWASALKRYRHLSPNMLLYWTMLEAGINEGYTTFDFGRSTRDAGTHHFKLQWGATDFPLYWESVAVSGEGQAAAMVEKPSGRSPLDTFVHIWQRLPLGVANLLGPHVIRHVV